MTTADVKRAWNRWAIGAWVILIIVNAIVIGVLAHDSHRISQRAQENKALVAQINKQKASFKQLEQEQDDSCKNYLQLRSAVNTFHGTLRKLLRTAEAARRAAYHHDHLPADRKAAREYHRLLRSIHTVKRTCAQRRH